MFGCLRRGEASGARRQGRQRRRRKKRRKKSGEATSKQAGRERSAPPRPPPPPPCPSWCWSGLRGSLSCFLLLSREPRPKSEAGEAAPHLGSLSRFALAAEPPTRRRGGRRGRDYSTEREKPRESVDPLQQPLLVTSPYLGRPDDPRGPFRRRPLPEKRGEEAAEERTQPV